METNTITEEHITLARRLPYRAETVKTVFDLIGDSKRATDLLELTARLGINPVETAEIYFECNKPKRLVYPRQVRAKSKYKYIVVNGVVMAPYKNGGIPKNLRLL